MDLQQTVQDLAEAWVAASTDTSFSRTQVKYDVSYLCSYYSF